MKFHLNGFQLMLISVIILFSHLDCVEILANEITLRVTVSEA